MSICQINKIALKEAVAQNGSGVLSTKGVL